MGTFRGIVLAYEDFTKYKNALGLMANPSEAIVCTFHIHLFSLDFSLSLSLPSSSSFFCCSPLAIWWKEQMHLHFLFSNEKCSKIDEIISVENLLELSWNLYEMNCCT